MACDTLSTNDIVISIMLPFVEVIVQEASLDPDGCHSNSGDESFLTLPINNQFVAA